MKFCKDVMKSINKELGSEIVSIEDNDGDYAIFVKYEDKVNYAICCADTDSMYNELLSLFNGIELAKTVFNKED